MSDTRTTHNNAAADGAAQAENPFGDGGGDAAERAAAYGRIARQARESCDRGEDAVQALHQRRNRSGQ